jgi:hypothetical protein
MKSFCASYFGRACTISRKPFYQNNVTFVVDETFCIPEECDNSDDLDSGYLLRWYDVAFKSRRYGQNYRYSYTEISDISCPSATVLIILICVIIVVLAIICVPIAWYVFIAPKERGRVLQGSDDDYYETAVEPIPGSQGMAMLNASDSSGMQNARALQN